MYQYRIMFELSQQQIKKYIKIYHRKMDWPISLFIGLCAAIFLVLIWIFNIISNLSLKVTVSVCIIAIFLIIYVIFRAIRIGYLIKKPPFAIGPHISMEIRDGYFNVNCCGFMKGYPKNYLNGKITRNGDYILTNRKDMIVIPRAEINMNMAEELKEYFKLKNKKN